MVGIVRHIHQIWIGSNPLPIEWMYNIHSFCKIYNYKYTLWTEQSIKSLNFDEFPGLKDIYNATERLSGKCNILRLLILYYYGGIYIDADCVILNFENLVKFLKKNGDKTFLAWESLIDEHFKKFSKNTQENSDMYGRDKIIANSIIGAKKGAPFIKMLLDQAPLYFWEHYGKGSWRETGPGYTVNMYDLYKGDDVNVYPMRTFYPSGWHNITRTDQHLDYIKSKSLFFQYGYSTNNFAKRL
jgi:mannosyltransferase OCH1-like enzyme